jgi:hypothetical protein
MKACFSVRDPRPICAGLAERLRCRVAFEFDGASIEVAASSERAVERLRRVYRYFLAAPQPAGDAAVRGGRMVLLEAGSAEAAMLARRLGRPGTADENILLADWFGWGLRIESDALLHYYASKMLRLRVVECWDDEVVTLHAASLTGPDGGDGILMIGEAAAGKTSLSLRLIDAAGFRYCADDTSCIRRRDMMCAPFPMAFVVRAALDTGRPAPTELDPARPDIALLDEPRWLLERWDAVGAPFRPRTLYFLDADTSLPPGRQRPVAEAQAALLLLRNLVMPLGADPEATAATLPNFEFACRLAGMVRSVAVNSSDLDRAFDAITTDYHAAAVAAA